MNLSKQQYEKIRSLYEWLTYKPLLSKKFWQIITILGLLYCFFTGVLSHLEAIQSFILLLTIYTGAEWYGKVKHKEGFVEGFANGMAHPTIAHIDQELEDISKLKEEKK
ncbi:MAG: hypothetical protein ACRDFB_03205, partial [Rhabdochlamydiaceae bacterium]